jgi:hypothetical protein
MMNEQLRSFRLASKPISSIKRPLADTKKSIELALSGDSDGLRDFLILFPEMVSICALFVIKAIEHI